MWLWLACLAVAAVFLNVEGAGAGAARLICYVENAQETTGFSECTHLVYAGNARGEKLEVILKEYRKNNPRLKIILRIADGDKDLRKLLKSKNIQGLEISDAHRTLNRSHVEETVDTARKTLRSAGGGPLLLSLPSHPELLAKYYDMRSLMKKVDMMVVQTHSLGQTKKMTYHPSRLSGVWDMMNTDSVVDLVIGLGVPVSKVVISLPSTALKFSLQNETLSTPGSPALDDEPKEINQKELCRMLQKGRWTLERDQDLSAPYAFQDKTWISFEDSSSVDVKGKYARVRGLAGLALMDADKDAETSCGTSLKAALGKVLNQQSRAPRAAVLRSLEHEILSAPAHARALDALQVSPYRITQVVDSDGVIHSIREDTRTEFSCTRQGYFVHPRSCARFYRCVKFDQLSSEYTVFEFDCPSGLAFDSRYEVCVWPGSLPDSQACPGSSEIAPVPHTRFICPDNEGYYADPENCRWFFACLDHGKAPLTAYEFRCPFGLGFDAQRLKCDWPWLVPECGNIARYEAQAHGFSTAVLTGAVGYRGQTADDINVAAHHSLSSGAAADNLVGIQSHNLGQQDALDTNFIASQELASGLQNGLAYQNHDVSANGNTGLVQPRKYNEEEKYTSGSIILDDYRLPTKPKSAHRNVESLGFNQNPYSGSVSSGNIAQKYLQYQNSGSYEDQSGRYVHDPTGDHAEPYRHIDSPDSPYAHQDSGYNDYYDASKYSQGKYEGSYKYQGGYKNSGNENSGGQYVHDNSGAYVSNDNVESYRNENSGLYVNDNSGQYVAGVYRTDGHIGNQNIYGTSNADGLNIGNYQGGYSNANAGNYLTDSKAYTGASHTLTNGAVNVGLVGKTTLVDASYNDQANNENNGGYSTQYQHGQQFLHPGHVSVISQPAVSINHVGTDSHNLDGYNFVTTPTPPVIPSTGAPYAVTSIPTVTTTYHTTYIPEPPKSTVKEIFGVAQQPITYVQPTVKPVAVSPGIKVTNYNQGVNYNAENTGQTVKSESGYSYDKPTVKFEDGLTYSAPAQTVSTYRPQSFGHSQQTLHKVESVGFQYAGAEPVTEEPFKKIVAYTTGPSIATFGQPTVASYTPQSISQQTVHQVNDINYNIQEPKAIEYSTAQPPIAVQSVVSTYQPQYQQTIHNVDVNHVNTYSQGESGYEYSKPAVQLEVQNTIQYTSPAPDVGVNNGQAYSHQTVHAVHSQPKGGYEYSKPIVTVPEQTVIQYSTPATETVPTNNAQSYSQQTIHHSYNQGQSGYEYQQPAVQLEDQELKVKYASPTNNEQSIGGNNGQAYSQQTVHSVNSQTNGGYEYSKPIVTVPQQTITQYSTPATETVATNNAQSYSQQTIHHSYNHGPSGYEYQQPAVQLEEQELKVKYATPATLISTNNEQSNGVSNSQAYSHQTLHAVNNQPNGGYEYSKPIVTVPQQNVIQYSTPATETVATNNAQSFSQQTIHNSYNEGQAGYVYPQPSVQLEEQKFKVEYSTPATFIPTNNAQSYSQQTLHNVHSKGYIQSYQQPAVSVYQNPILEFTQKVTPAVTYATPTYKPQSYSQQTYHKVETSKVSLPSVATVEQQVQYTTAQPHLNLQPVISTYQPHVFSHQTLHQVDVGRVNALVENGGQKSFLKLQETPGTLTQYTTQTPTVKPDLAYSSQIYSKQTQHNVDAGHISTGFEYQQHIAQPDYVVSTYQPQTYSQQTLHQVNAGQVNRNSAEQGYEYPKPAVKLQTKPETVYQFTTPTPTTAHQPQVYSQQTLHEVETPQVNTYFEDTYEYQRPLVKLEQQPETFVQYTTPTPAVVSTYRPQKYSQQGIQKVQSIVPVSSTALPQVEYKQSTVTLYENPILEFTKNVTPKPISTVISNRYQPSQYEAVDQQSYSNIQHVYNQPEIQRNHQQSNVVKSYSDASLVSQQRFNLGSGNNENKGQHITFVSTTPANLVYEDRYSQYETQKSNPFQVQDNYDYKPLEDTQQTGINQKNVQISFRNEQRNNGGSVHFSTFPGTRVVTKYKKVNNVYQEPEIQDGYQAEEYLPPVVSTSYPVVTSSLRPVAAPSTNGYLPPSEPTYSSPEYLPPRTEKEYLPPSTTVRQYVKSTTPTYIKSTTSREYLPPSDNQEPHVVSFESFGLKNIKEATPTIAYNSYGRQKNIVVQNSKSNLLGFGTVGPDAGLVGHATYTTSSPILSSNIAYTPRPVEPAEETPFTVPVRKIRPRVRPVTSTTEPQYKFVESTTHYQAPEYLPPNDKIVLSVPRKHNLVVQTAKSNLLGYSTVGPDAGLLSTVSTIAPIEVPSSEKYYSGTVTSTYAPSTEQIVEVVRPRIPARRIKPKVAVVTKINDFNPLLVRKLGAVCSCQSPIVVLKGRRPSLQQEVEDYDTDYNQDDRDDKGEQVYSQKSARLQTFVSTAAPVTSTFNPIIVPDDSYYQDYEDDSTIKEIGSRINLKSSIPAYSSTTEKIVRIRPRVKSVTIAPTFQTVLLKQSSPVDVVQKSDALVSSVESQSFDRYGPGGWRGRDETLQGSVDCQRAGLFRHPKHCNKFYACRWDCTKQRFTLHVFNCPVQLSFDSNIGACNWPSQGPACQGDTLLANAV